MRQWRKSPTLAVITILVFAVVQITLPLARINGGDTARRFGWQMFSNFVPEVEFRVRTPEGDVTVDIEEVVARLRADIDYVEVLPPHLCESMPNAMAVTWKDKAYQC